MKNGQFTIPYSTELPGLAFNSQLSKLEIVGDIGYGNSNKNHIMMSIFGSFSDASDSFFDGDAYFEVVYNSVKNRRLRHKKDDKITNSISF